MKKTLYLSLVAMMLANINVQNAYGASGTDGEFVKEFGTAPQSSRFQDALSALKESCMEHQSSLVDRLEGWMKAAYENLPSDRRDEFIDLLERAGRVSSDRAWEEFEDKVCVIDNGSYSSEDVALLSLRMFFRHDEWVLEKNISSLDLLLPIMRLRASIAPTDEFPLSFISLHFDDSCVLGNAGIKQIIPLLEANHILRLSVNDYEITADRWQTFINALKQNSSLIFLNISHHNVRDAEFNESLAECLKANNSITILDLPWAKIETAKIIYDVIRSGQNTELTKVYLPNDLVNFPFGTDSSSIASLLRRASATDAK